VWDSKSTFPPYSAPYKNREYSYINFWLKKQTVYNPADVTLKSEHSRVCLKIVQIPDDQIQQWQFYVMKTNVQYVLHVQYVSWGHETWIVRLLVDLLTDSGRWLVVWFNFFMFLQQILWNSFLGMCDCPVGFWLYRTISVLRFKSSFFSTCLLDSNT